MSIRLLYKNSFITIVAKIVNALFQILCLPVLIKTFGKDDYGLIVIAMSLNTFVAILQFGLPTGLPKFVAEWLAKGERKELDSALRAVSTFYLLVAATNLLILLFIALWGSDVFNVRPDQTATLQSVLIITAISSFLAIPATMLDQSLAGAQEIGFTSCLEMIKNLFFASLVVFVYFEPQILSLSQFYVMRCTLMFLMIPFKLRRWQKHGSLTMFIPGLNFKAALPLLKYCLALMAFGIFTVTAEKLRPIILGIRIPSDAGNALTDFQIIDYARIFLAMVSSSFITVLVPYISGAVADGNNGLYKKIIIRGTKIVWTLGALMGFVIIMLSKEVILIYVGPEYLHLQKWLELLIIGFLYNLYNPAMSSAILSTNTLTPLIFATSIGSLISFLICWGFSASMGVGAIVYSLIGYNAVVFCVTHFWYFPRYFNVNPIHQIFNVMLPPLLAGISMCIIGRWIIDFLGFTNNYINITVGALSGTIIYIVIILLVYIRPTEINNLILKR